MKLNCFMCTTDIWDAYYCFHMFAFFQIYLKFNFLEELYKFAYLPIGCGVHQENLITLFKAALVFFEATRIFCFCIY